MLIINVEYVSDILSSNLTQLAIRHARRGEQFNDFKLYHTRPLHTELPTGLNLGIATFLREDLSTAHQLVQRKKTIRQLEASANRKHPKKLWEDKNARAESGDILQRVLRDYRRVHCHIAAITYPVTDRLGNTLLWFIETPLGV